MKQHQGYTDFEYYVKFSDNRAKAPKLLAGFKTEADAKRFAVLMKEMSAFVEVWRYSDRIEVLTGPYYS